MEDEEKRKANEWKGEGDKGMVDRSSTMENKNAKEKGVERYDE